MDKKNNSKQPLFFASCPKGLEIILEKEIYSLGIKDLSLKRGGISFQSSYIKALKVLLNSRVASRVFEEIGFFFIAKEKDIYNQGIRIAWSKIFNVNQTFKINTILDRETNNRFRNSLILSQILKDSIVDQFRKVGNNRPDIDTKRPDISFLLRIEAKGNDKFGASILIDLSGEPLSNRGYRKANFPAPLRENLAAGIVMNTDWDHNKEEFIDSMCGSGTLLIEAALIKGEIPPSYLKLINYKEKEMSPWAFLKHNKFLRDFRIQAEFKKIANELYKRSRDNMFNFKDGKLFGFDNDPKALAMARENIIASKLPIELFDLQNVDALKACPPSNKTGIIICNPPYGERMGDDLDSIKTLYHDYGETLKNNWKNFKAYIFTGKPELRKNISLQTSKRIQLYNGNIECRLFRYDLF